MLTRSLFVATLVAALGIPVLALADDSPKTDADEPQCLSDAQVAKVVKTHMHEVQDCWQRLPAKDRSSDSSVVLGLSIAPKGEVIDTTIISDAPAETRSCIASVARQWTFPVVALASDIEYPLTLRAH